MPAAPAPRRPITQAQRESVGNFLGTFRTTVTSVLLLGWMQIMIVRPIREMGKEMATMDPLEVVDIPFPVKSIRYFALLPIAIGFGWFLKTYGFGKASSLALLYAQLFSLSYALFGAAGSKYMIETVTESLPTAAYMAMLLLLTSDINETSLQTQLPFSLYATGGNAVSFARLYGMISGCTLFSLLVIFDKTGPQMKRWPVPVLLGLTYGYVAGSLGGVWLRHYQQQKWKSNSASTGSAAGSSKDKKA